MVEVTFLNTAVVLLAWFARFKGWQFLLKVSFGLLFIFLALRYEFGNDYNSYLKEFLSLDPSLIVSFSSKMTNHEPGWLALCHLFRPLGKIGFFLMVAMLSLLSCVVYYRFIAKHVAPSYYWLATFLYVFNPYLMLVQSSAMRQSAAVSCFILSLDYLSKRRLCVYFLFIGLAISFHYSALVLVPLSLLSISRLRIGMFSAIGLLAGYAIVMVFVLFTTIPRGLMSLTINSYLPTYAVYAEQTGTQIQTGMGTVFYLVLLVLLVVYERHQSAERALVFKIAIASDLFRPLALVMMMAGRIVMYFEPANIVALPSAVSGMKNIFLKISIIAALAAFTISSFFGFFHSSVWSEHFSTYRTVFSSGEF